MTLSLRQVENISFHMKLVSQLAALIWKPGVHRNTDRKNQVMCRNIGKSLHDMIILDVICLQNGSKFLHDTFSRQSRHYFLSHKPSQPIGRAGFSAWRS